MRCQPRHKGPVYIWLKNKQSCLLCGESTDTPQPICTPCESELPWLGDQCSVCALPLPMAGMRCGQCASQPPAFERVLAPWAYDFPVDSLITRFKHQAKWPLGRLMGELLAQSLQHHFDEGLERPGRTGTGATGDPPFAPARFQPGSAAGPLAQWAVGDPLRRTPAATHPGHPRPTGTRCQGPAAKPASGLCPGAAGFLAQPSLGVGRRCAHHRRHRPGAGCPAARCRRCAGRCVLPGAHAETR